MRNKKQLDTEFYSITFYFSNKEEVIEYVENKQQECDCISMYEWGYKKNEEDPYLIGFHVHETKIKKNEIKNYKPFYSFFDWRRFEEVFDKDGSRFPTIDKLPINYDLMELQRAQWNEEQRLNENYGFLKMIREDINEDINHIRLYKNY